MANKERNKRSARQARQRERAEREVLSAASSSGKAQGNKKAASSKTSDSKKAASSVKAKTEGTGLVARSRNYLGAVRGEMHRVTWPSRTELTNYSVTVIAMLIIFGLAVWLVDTGFVAGLVGFTGLRG